MKSPLLLLLGLIIAATPAAAADSQKRFAPRGVGLANCEQFLKALNERQENVYLIGGWIEGYVSAVNQLTPGLFDAVPWQSTESLVALVKQNCQQNPKERFFTVINSMIAFFSQEGLKESSPRIIAEAGGKKIAIYQATMREIQQKLVDKGYLKGAPDGQFGPKTKTALEAYQKAEKLQVTGLPDQMTLWRLLGPKPGKG